MNSVTKNRLRGKRGSWQGLEALQGLVEVEMGTVPQKEETEVNAEVSLTGPREETMPIKFHKTQVDNHLVMLISKVVASNFSLNFLLGIHMPPRGIIPPQNRDEDLLIKPLWMILAEKRSSSQSELMMEKNLIIFSHGWLNCWSNVTRQELNLTLP